MNKYFDHLEQVILLTLFIWFLIRLWPQSFAEAHMYTLLLIISESIVVLLVLFRRTTDFISKHLQDWLIAFAGTTFVLLVDTGGEPFLPMLGIILLFFGMFVHIGAKLSLLRSFGVVAANRGVKTGGLYSIIRHPMYAGYFLTHLGFWIAAPSTWNLIIYVLVWSLLVARIFAEENILTQTSQEYKLYRSTVKYRIIPGVF